MPQHCDKSSNKALKAPANKTTLQEDLKRRPIHPTHIDKDKKFSDDSQKDDANKLHPNPKDCMDEEDSLNFDTNVVQDTKEISNETWTVVEKSPFKTIFFCLMIIAIIIIGVYSYVPNKSHEERYSLSQLIDNMMIKFSNQPQHTFKVLKGALKDVVDEDREPLSPAIIILLANKDAVETAKKFSEYLVELLEPKFVFTVDSEIYGCHTSEEIKSVIDKKLKSNLNDYSLKVIMVDNLAKVPFEAAMIFHSYCDHANARFKRAVYLFIVPSNDIVPETANSKHIDTIAMEHLRQVWQNAHADLIESLITRITVSVINVK